MKRQNQPLFVIQLALFFVSVFCFLYILFDTITNKSFHEQDLLYSFLFMALNTTSIIGFKKISSSWYVYLIGILPMMLFVIPHMIPSVDRITTVAAIVVASGILLLMRGEFRYVAANGIFLGIWLLLILSYLYLHPRFGTMNTITIVFSDYGMKVLLKFMWFIFVFPIAIIPLVNFLQLPWFSPKFQPNTDNHSHSEEVNYQEITQSLHEKMVEEDERIFELEVLSDSLRFSQASSAEVNEVDNELGRGVFDTKYEDDKFDYGRKN